MLKKSVFVLIAAFLLGITAVSALSFEVRTERVTDTITLDELAEFKLTITNNLGSEQEYRIVKLDYPYWDVYTKPIVHPISIKVPPHENRTINLFIDPLHVLSIGTVDVNIRVKRENSEEEKSVPFRIILISSKSAIEGYIPTVIANVAMPTEIDPREELTLNVRLDNQNMLEYDDLLLKIESNTINEEVRKDLGANEKKDFEVIVQLDPKTKAQKDVLTVTLYSKGRVIDGPKTTNFRVISYSDVSKEIVPLSAFLRIKKEVIFTNNGNSKYAGPVKIETSPLRSLFTLTRPRGKSMVKEGKKYISWDVELEPDASKTVTISENYTVLLVFIILAIIGIIAYKMYRSPLSIKKETANIEKKEGGISELKVILTVKNRGTMPLKDIKVTDKIPNIANIERELTIGTLQPTKILKHENKGTIIKWVIEELGIGEERIITYRIKSALAILGEFNLPPAVVSFMSKNRHKKAKSNSLAIS